MLIALLSNLIFSQAMAQIRCEAVFLQSNSQKYAELELYGEKSDQLIRSQNRIHLENQKASNNKKPIEKWLWEAYDKEQVLDVETLSANEDRKSSRNPRAEQVQALSGSVRLKLVSRGLGKSTDLVLDNKGTEKVLFSNFNYKRNNSVAFVRFELSPKKEFAVMMFEENGSLDRFWLQVLDLRSGLPLGERIETRSSSIAWITDSQFAYSVDRKDQHAPLYDIRTQSYSESPTLKEAYSSMGEWSLFRGGLKNEQMVLQKLNEKPLILADKNSYDIVHADENQILFMSQNEDGFEQITRRDLKTHRTEVLIPAAERVMLQAQVIDSKVFVWSIFGPERKLEIFDAQGNPLQELIIPLEMSLNRVEKTSRPQTFRLSFSSNIRNREYVFWKLGDEIPWKNLQSKMMADNQVRAKSVLSFATSEDGTKIPVRLVMRQDLRPDGSHPAYIESYGGFESMGYFPPSYDLEVKEFIRRGGIYVAPQIRGGNEAGPEWHEQAQGAKKLITSAKDLVAVAKMLSQHRYSNPKKIISTGTSNGGRLVALAGLLAPEAFGLVIPINGVHDLLGKERLDEKFNFGWSDEFGDSRIPEDLKYLEKISAVEMTYDRGQGHRTQFFTVSGLNDSRVHPAHSRKLQASLLEQVDPQTAQMMALKNSGHWMGSPGYQNVIGWRTQSSIWIRIYDLIGWDFSKEP